MARPVTPPRIVSLEAQAPEGDLLAWEVLGVADDGQKYFIASIFETVFDFNSLTLTVGDEEFTVSLN